MKTIDKLPRYILEELAIKFGFRQENLKYASHMQLAKFISDSL